MQGYKKLTILFSVCCVFIAGCASEQEQKMINIPAFQQTDTTQVNKIRVTVLKDTARSVGAQAGLYWAQKQINCLLIKQKPMLDRVFNFQAMMLDDNVIPPVLEESVNILNQNDDSNIRLADRMYKIDQPARFSTVVPSWRDYLYMNFNKPESPDASLLPNNNAERDIWNRYIIVGWNEGIMQGQDLFELNLNRLVRDYQGMILYRKLLAQHIVTPPFVAKADLGITGGGNDLWINDRVLRITAVSQLQPNSKNWKTRLYTPTSSQRMATARPKIVTFGSPPAVEQNGVASCMYGNKVKKCKQQVKTVKYAGYG
jgi:defect-in-organelle-trafficking protein DotC